MSEEDLMTAALEAREMAYAPYSGYRVGCALEVEDGTVFAAANVENASYGLCVCAERGAVVKAVTAGHKSLKTAVVATQSSPPAAPCGLCRQTFNEFVSSPEDFQIILVNPAGQTRKTTLAELFPMGFRGSHLD